MKKHISLLLVCLVAMMGLVTGCKKSPAEESARQITAMTQKMSLPIKINDATTLTDCYYRDHTLTYRNETSADTLAAINLTSLKNITIKNLSENPNAQKLVKHLKTAKASVRYIYVSGNDSVMISFSADEIPASNMYPI